MQGYDALRGGAAWLDASGRGVLIATGEDRVRLLHAITTNHIQQLKPGEGCYAFLLNAQGRIQADLNILVFGNRVLLDTEPETARRAYEHIDRYIIADDVTLEDGASQTAVIAVEGPGAEAALGRAGIPVPAAPFSHREYGETGVVARISSTGAPGFRLFLARQDAGSSTARLESAGVVPAGAEAARTVRLEHFKPRYGEDIFDTTLPHESRQLYAVHFNKGCYLGQEIVERVRSRGMVHRLLCGLLIDAVEPPPAGTPVMAGEAEAGKITSAAFSPAMSKVAALAYLRRENSEPGKTLLCAGNRAEVHLPYSA